MCYHTKRQSQCKLNTVNVFTSCTCVYHKIQVINEHFKTSGYTAVKRVVVEVTHDDDNVEVSADIVQSAEKCWYIEQQQVCVSVCTCTSLVILYICTLNNVVFT